MERGRIRVDSSSGSWKKRCRISCNLQTFASALVQRVAEVQDWAGCPFSSFLLVEGPFFTRTSPSLNGSGRDVTPPLLCGYRKGKPCTRVQRFEFRVCLKCSNTAHSKSSWEPYHTCALPAHCSTCARLLYSNRHWYSCMLQSCSMPETRRADVSNGVILQT